MNHTYRFHPGGCELGENEKFYSDMAARGWQLVRRGRLLSKFQRAKPSRARYRVEVSFPGFLEDSGLTEGQLAVFEDCGWEFVDSQGFLHIFRAPEGSSAPEFYTDPRQQAATLDKVRRDLLWGWGALLLVPLLCVLFARLAGDGLPGWWGKQVRHFVEVPEYTGYLFWLLYMIHRLACDTWQINRTYFRLQRGIPLDHAPRRRWTPSRLVGRGLLCLTALSLLSFAVHGFSRHTQDLPDTADGPYLLLADAGVEGERSELWYAPQGSRVTRDTTLIADCWDVFEIVDTAAGQQVWMYQDIYRLRLPGLALPLAWALMEDSIFPQYASEYESIDIPGLDAAWVYSSLEAVAVKGDRVAHLEYLTREDAPDGFAPEAVLNALARRWAEG